MFSLGVCLGVDCRARVVSLVWIIFDYSNNFTVSLLITSWYFTFTELQYLGWRERSLNANSPDHWASRTSPANVISSGMSSTRLDLHFHLPPPLSFLLSILPGNTSFSTQACLSRCPRTSTVSFVPSQLSSHPRHAHHPFNVQSCRPRYFQHPAQKTHIYCIYSFPRFWSRVQASHQ